MKKYYVSLIVDATVMVTVEAETEEEAIAKAFEEADSPCLCHQCSDTLEVGDFTGESVVSEAD